MTNPQLPKEFIWATDIELGSPEVYRLSALSWPRFLLEEPDIPDPLLKFQISMQEFKERFQVFGIRERSSGTLIAFIQVVHVKVDLTQPLPDMGWRFSIHNAAQNTSKNCLSLVEASIDADFRGHGLSKILLARCKEEARRKGYSHLIAPVRPNAKENFPNESAEAYLTRRRADGRLFDFWLRTHIEAGANLLNICHHSVCIQASVDQWRAWTGLPLAQSGPQVIPHGLMPMTLDLDRGIGVYNEPNVWVSYDLSY